MEDVMRALITTIVGTLAGVVSPNRRKFQTARNPRLISYKKSTSTEL